MSSEGPADRFGRPISSSTSGSPGTNETSDHVGLLSVEGSRIVLEQYRLAVEMAAEISTRRQAANSFYIALISAFAALQWLPETKATETKATSGVGFTLSAVAVCVCIIWWVTLHSYRMINIAKWDVIEYLETKLPEQPFTLEGQKLGRKRKPSSAKEANSAPPADRSFAITTVEIAVPIVVGLIFLWLAASSLLEFITART